VLALAKQMLLVFGRGGILAGLEFAVLDHGDADAAVDHAGEIGLDALFNRRSGLLDIIGVGIRQVGNHGAFDHLDPFSRLYIAAVFLFRSGNTAFTPEVALVDIVIVRNYNHWNIPTEIPPLQQPHDPFA
jgi:hypothetical protein